jgi:DNA-binding ferritin-like protein
MALEKLATVLRALQLYGQHAHNNCAGKSFIPDHDMFASSYQAAADAYDSVVERIIGSTGKPVDTMEISLQAIKLTASCSRNPGECNTEFLRGVLKLELATCVHIDQLCESRSLPEGTRQLIGDIADKSMSRQYKLKQRLKE